MSQSDLTWDVKLARLQDQLHQTNEELATTLGISTRTLSECRREGASPSQPIQRLIDLLLGDGLERRVESNLIVIHGDFRAPEGEDPSKMIVEMLAAGGDAQRDNEFHYIAVDSSQIAKKDIETLVRMRIQPHILAEDSVLLNEDSKDCYFSTLVIMLATQATRRNLSHITIAADVLKFWPLARELSEILNVGVTFIREFGSAIDVDKLEAIERLDIKIANPSGRKSGFVGKLLTGSSGGGPFGFIVPINSFEKPIKGAKGLFFSYRHMRNGSDGQPETEISKLSIGDMVSFKMGMNFEGPCATDVALVEKNSIDPTTLESRSPREVRSKENKNDMEIRQIIKDAINTCANEDGLALLSRVGSRVEIAQKGFWDLMGISKYATINAFIKKYHDVFEYFENGADAYVAACVRIRRN